MERERKGKEKENGNIFLTERNVACLPASWMGWDGMGWGRGA